MADPTGTLEPRPGDSNNMLLQKILLNLADLPGTFLTPAEGDLRYLKLTGGTLTGALGINLSGLTAPTPLFTGPQVVGLAGAQVGYTVEAFAENARIGFRRANGTAIAPSALLSGETIGTFYAGGYGATGYSAARASVRFYTNENWTDTAQGTTIDFNTIITGTATVAAVFRAGAYGVAGLVCGGDKSMPSWGTVGCQSTHGTNVAGGGYTITDTSAAGTVATAVAHLYGIPTFAATNARTITDAANLYIAGDVAAGTNVTLTNSYGLWNVGKTRLDGVTRITATTASSLSTNGALVVSGGAGFGGNINTIGAIQAASGGLSGNFQASITGSPTFVATATGFNASFYAGATTANTVVTYPKVVGLYVDDVSKGAASTITEQIGIYIKAQTKGATNYGIYQAGTEANYFGGAIAIGNTVAAGVGVASTHKVTISIGGNTYYLLASNV